MLGATTDRLHRCPHVTIAGNEIPPGRNKIAGLDLASRVNRFRSTLTTVRERLCPNNVPIAFYHHMCAAEFKRFLGIKRGVNSAENHISTPLSCHLSNFIAAQSVGGMNTDPDGVPLLNSARIHLE